MSYPRHHIIHKLNLLIDTPDGHTARRMYREAGSLLQQYVLPQLEELLQQYETGGKHIRLDTLQVDLNVISANGSAALEETIRYELAKAIALALKKKVEEAPLTAILAAEKKEGHLEIRQEAVQALSGSKQVTEAFLFFLEKGMLPWWYHSASGNILDVAILTEAIAEQESAFSAVLLQRVQQYPFMLDRIIKQCDPQLLIYLFSLLAPLDIFSAAQEQYKILQAVAAKSSTVAAAMIHRYFWQKVWTCCAVSHLPAITKHTFLEQLEPVVLFVARLLNDAFAIPGVLELSPSLSSSEHPDNASVAPLIYQALYAATAPVAGDSAEASKPLSGIPDAVSNIPGVKDTATVPENEQWLANAGLILLHPFLQYFFAELKLMQGHDFKDEAARHTAVQLLHYLATKEDQAPDFDLAMEKYLCDMPVGTCTDRFKPLPGHMKEEAMQLLRSVTGHWKALKNTSEEGLQQGFLQRKGKLLITDQQHRLILESYAQDILLQQIPWNISLIKLPWLSQLLHVDWTGDN